MDKKLTNRQDLFAKHYALGHSGSASAVKAGYSEKSAASIASENLTKPNVVEKIQSILDDAGLSDSALAERLREAIDAGLTKRPSNSDSIKGIALAYKLRDRFPDARARIEVSSVNDIRTELQQKSPEELESYLIETARKTQEILERMKERRKRQTETSSPL